MSIINTVAFGVTAAALMLSTAAGAAVLDLSQLPIGAFTAPVTIGDYVLTPAANGSGSGSAAPAHLVVNGLDVLTGTDYFAGDDTFLTRVDGRAFTLNSVDIGLIEGYRRGQNLSSAKGGLDLDFVATATVQTIRPGSDFANVRSVDLDALVGPYFANIDVSAVPEPGAWSLMLLGIGGLGAALRASRATKARALA